MKLHVWAPGFSVFQGGIGAHGRALAKALRDLGHDVRLYGKFDTPGTWDGFPIWGAGNSSGRLQTARFAAGLLAACAYHRPERVVSLHLNFGPVAQLVKRLLGIPFTLTVHGIEMHENLPQARRRALRNADLVFADSAWSKQRLMDTVDLDPVRVRILPCTVDASRFSQGCKSERLMTRYNLKPDEQVVLTVARLDAREAYKGYDRVVQALPSIRKTCGPVRYILAGKGDDEVRVQSLARQLSVEDAVTFAGFVADDELADHYRLADAFAMPSTGEGFGIVFLEALACGTPVLAGNRDGSVDAVDKGRLGRLVDPTDVRQIANGLVDLLQRKGPELWFERGALHDAVVARFGSTAFREELRSAFPTS
jgi:glycosyltransferase involved in cell wall biosynthesis